MNLPNKLTMLRIAMIPLFVATFYMPFDSLHLLGLAIFVIAFITDLIDGQIARKYNLITNFGKFMDPIADKLLTLAALIMLLAFENFSPIAIILILSREFLVSAMRMVAAASEGIVISASWLGKAKTVSQFAAICAGLLEKVLALILGANISRIVVMVFVIGCTVLTVWSGIDYFLKNSKFIDHTQ